MANSGNWCDIGIGGGRTDKPVDKPDEPEDPIFKTLRGYFPPHLVEVMKEGNEMTNAEANKTNEPEEPTEPRFREDQKCQGFSCGSAPLGCGNPRYCPGPPEKVRVIAGRVINTDENEGDFLLNLIRNTVMPYIRKHPFCFDLTSEEIEEMDNEQVEDLAWEEYHNDPGKWLPEPAEDHY